MFTRRRIWQVLLLLGVVVAAQANSGCDTYVGVGVGYGYPARWRGPYIGSYPGTPIYR